MHPRDIEEIVREIEAHLTGRFVGKILQVSPLSLAVDFGSRDGGYLFISVEPLAPRIYLIKRRARELQKQSLLPLPFTQGIQASLGGSTLISVNKEPSERIVRLLFSHQDELGQISKKTLLVQLTGRSANLYLLDHNDRITHALRPPQGVGQQIGDEYQPPPTQAAPAQKEERLQKGDFATFSEAADDYHLKLEAAKSFDSRAKTLLGKLNKELSQSKKLESNLNKDLVTHGDPERHKRLGDLLLANIANARRDGNKVIIKDYFSEGAPDLEIEIDENTSLQDHAAACFSRYTKAKRARAEIATRLTEISKIIAETAKRKAELEEIVSARDEVALAKFAGPQEAVKDRKPKSKAAEKLPGVRRYRSSDGYEVLVGRAARTNDQLTFKVARPNDWWLHAADYPGSHVIIRNQGRGEIPQRTIIEAAQIAAKFSQAGDDAKVVIHYTQRKFLSKPKGAAAGLVRMSKFHTTIVQPGENIPRIVVRD